MSDIYEIIVINNSNKCAYAAHVKDENLPTVIEFCRILFHTQLAEAGWKIEIIYSHNKNKVDGK